MRLNTIKWGLLLDFLLNRNIYDIDSTHFKIHINLFKGNSRMIELGSFDEIMNDLKRLRNDLLIMMLGLNLKEYQLALQNQINRHF